MKFIPPDGYEVATKNNTTGPYGIPRTVVYHGSDGAWHATHTSKDGTVTHYPKDCAPHSVVNKFVFMFDGLLSRIYNTMMDKGKLVVDDNQVERTLEMHVSAMEKHYREIYADWHGDLVRTYACRTTAAEQGYKPERRSDTLLSIDPPVGWTMVSLTDYLSETTALVAEWYPEHGFALFLWINNRLRHVNELLPKDMQRLEQDLSKEPLVRLVKALPDHPDQFTLEYVAQQCAEARKELYARYGRLKVRNYFRTTDEHQVPLESMAEEFLSCIPQKELVSLWKKYGNNVIRLPNSRDALRLYGAKLFQVLEKTPKEE